MGTSTTAGSRPVCVAVINMKGGVGKTTVVALLARRAADHGLKVLAIDLDPQANLSQALMEKGYREFLTDGSPSIVEIFKGFVPPTDDLPSPRRLNVDDVVVSVGRSLDLIPSRFDFSDHLIETLKPDPTTLARLIASEVQKYQLVVIDCAPTESIFTRAAYHASRYVVVPVKPEYFATIGFPLLHESLADFMRHHPTHRIDVAGVVVNNSFYHGGNDGGPEKWASMADITKDATSNDWHVFKSQMPHSRGFPKMMRGDYSYSGNAGVAYPDFTDEILRRLGLAIAS